MMLVAPKREGLLPAESESWGLNILPTSQISLHPSLLAFRGSLVGTQVLVALYSCLMESVLGDIFAGG